MLKKFFTNEFTDNITGKFRWPSFVFKMSIIALCGMVIYTLATTRINADFSVYQKDKDGAVRVLYFDVTKTNDRPEKTMRIGIKRGINETGASFSKKCMDLLFVEVECGAYYLAGPKDQKYGVEIGFRF